ncbi:hypothetical protein Cgig2_020836 [Carnegiea gigantea]|uniref:glutathione gamma-glutamylcysteinyltransferase n=1 Tax=Carnegiea gigantea TaxID=171969 RepID=A0A9Q1KI52_9CARY|nr:hypothetical protein Cgig2_020836 [Carnegiea gigantea]
MAAVAGLYRRALPSPPAIEFASSEGKVRLSLLQNYLEALANGNMDGFFKLISYYQTQSEPAFCGLATLAMVLNALGIDPGRKWKGPWRWFDDSMLDCCEPLEKVKVEGISFGKVACLAHCNGAKVDAFHTNESTVDSFRNYVMTCASSEDCHMIVSYNRKHLKQSCRRSGWDTAAKYLTEEVPHLLSSNEIKGIQGILSVILASAPKNLRDFINWVAEVRKLEDGNKVVNEEERKRLSIKEEVLKQVQETELYKYITKWIQLGSCCSSTSVGGQGSLCEIASKVCCQGAQLLCGKVGACNGTTHSKHLGPESAESVTVVSGKVLVEDAQHGFEMLVPCRQRKCGDSCVRNQDASYGNHPSTEDVLTILLLALPSDTWCAVKDEKLQKEFSVIVSLNNLPDLLQQEVSKIL